MSQTLWSLIAPSLKQYQDYPAWICRQNNGTRHITYKALRTAVLNMARTLRDRDIQAGDTVGVTAPNGPEWTVAALAAWKLGAVVAPIHIGNSEYEINQQVKAVSPKIMLVHEADMSCDNQLSITLENDEDSATKEDAINLDIDETSVAVRICTSGSTGSPKIVRLSHVNLVSNTLAASGIVVLSTKDRFLSLLPLSHAMGITATMLTPLYNGAAIVTPKVLAASEILETLEQENISVVIAVPRLFRNVMIGLEKKFSAAGAGLKLYLALLRILPLPLRQHLNAPIRKKFGGRINAWVSGGNHLDSDISRYYHQLGLPLRQGYGLTETSPLACIQDNYDTALDSVGKPIEHVRIKIHNPNAHGKGEVWIKGPNVMLGYEDEEQTRAVLEDGWFKTGDIGKVDDQGKLTLTGRSKRLIVTSAGKNVYPEELETLLERDPVIKEVGVLEKDMKPVCVAAVDSDHPVAEVKRVLKNFNALVSAHNRISRFALVEELPKTPLGKTALQELPDLFEKNEHK